MIRPKSRLTITLKIYSLLALIYSIITFGSTFAAYMDNSSIPPLLINSIQQFLTIVINCILVIQIYRNKGASALFLPCLLSGISLVFSPLAYIAMILLTTTYANILEMAFWSIIGMAIFVLIAVDSKNGSKYALAELIALAGFLVLRTSSGLIRTFFSLHGFTGRYLTLNYLGYSLLSMILSSSVVIILFLWRIQSWREKTAVPATPAEQTPEDHPEIGQ